MYNNCRYLVTMIPSRDTCNFGDQFARRKRKWKYSTDHKKILQPTIDPSRGLWG